LKNTKKKRILAEVARRRWTEEPNKQHPKKRYPKKKTQQHYLLEPEKKLLEAPKTTLTVGGGKRT